VVEVAKALVVQEGRLRARRDKGLPFSSWLALGSRHFGRLESLQVCYPFCCAEQKKKLSTCRGGSSAVGPLLAVLRCRCAALLVLVLMSTLAMPNCGAQGAPTA
jgi:hypothetical protein